MREFRNFPGVSYVRAYENERRGPDHQCGPIQLRGPIDFGGPKVPLLFF